MAPHPTEKSSAACESPYEDRTKFHLENARLRMLWDKEMMGAGARHKYRKVAAQLISWDEKLSDLQTKSEVLSSVFSCLHAY